MEIEIGVGPGPKLDNKTSQNGLEVMKARIWKMCQGIAKVSGYGKGIMAKGWYIRENFFPAASWNHTLNDRFSTFFQGFTVDFLLKCF